MRETIEETWPNSTRETDGEAFIISVTSPEGVNTVRISTEDDDGFLLECLDAIMVSEMPVAYKKWMNIAASARLGSSVVGVGGIEYGVLFTKSGLNDVVGMLRDFMGCVLAVVKEYGA